MRVHRKRELCSSNIIKLSVPWHLVVFVGRSVKWGSMVG